MWIILVNDNPMLCFTDEREANVIADAMRQAKQRVRLTYVQVYQRREAE